jgi:RNA polymerase sigma factor (sigma-70 family)
MSQTAEPRSEEVATEPLEFETVYQRLAGPVYRFCLTQVGGPSAAEEVAADAWAAAWTAFERTHPTADGVDAWVFRIVRNTAKNHLRSVRRRLRLWVALANERMPVADVEVKVFERATAAEALTSLQAMRPRERTLIGLRVCSDLSFAEIGAVMDCSEAAARVATHRALLRLRARMEGIA